MDNGKPIEVSMTFDDGGKMFWPEFNSQRMGKNVYMVYG